MKIYQIPSCFVLVVIVSLLFSACSEPADPRTMPIDASSPAAFDAWKGKIRQRIPAAEMQELEERVKEIRLGIMLRKEASGVDPVAWKLCEYLNGKTINEVILLGYNTEIEAVTREIELQRVNIQKIEEGLNGPGSVAAKAPLRDHYAQVKDNVGKLEARLARAKARLAELQAKP